MDKAQGSMAGKIAPVARASEQERTVPLRSPSGDLSGLLNQARYLFRQGAASYQCTYLGPAVGTRDLEPAANAGAIYRRVGGRPVPPAFQDGNHVVASKHPRPWRQQLNVLRAHAAFYNPWNTLRVVGRTRPRTLRSKRLKFQLVGQIGLLLTVPKLITWAWRLKHGPIERYPGLPPARIPMVDADSGEEINWAIKHAPLPPERADMARAAATHQGSRATAGISLPHPGANVPPSREILVR